MKTVDALRKLVVAAGLAVLTACGGGGGGGGSEVDVLTLAGKIVAPLPDGADVIVTVDGEAFETKADENGDFTVAIESADAGALVTIFTKLAGSVSFVELSGRLGSFGDLLSDAGDDDTLNSDENIRTNVTSLSTAEAVLLDEAEDDGGTRRKSFTFGEDVDVDEALTLAAVIELTVKDPDEFALPDGASTTLDLARDGTLRETFADDIRQRAPNDLERSKQDLVGNTDVVGRDPDPGAPPELLAAFAGGERDYPFLSGNLISGFKFNQDGSGLYFNSTVTAPMTWVLSGSKLVVTPGASAVQESSASLACDDGSEGESVSRIRYQKFEIVRLSTRAVGVTETTQRTTTTCGVSETVVAVETQGRLAVKPDSVLPLSASELTGDSFALPVLGNLADPKLPKPINSDRVKFNADGTGSGEFIAGNFTWTLADNQLTVAFGGGVVGRYRVVRNIDGVARSFAADLETPTVRYADLLIGFAGSDDAAFVAAQIPARYFQFGVGNEQVREPGLQGFRLRFDADRTGASEDDVIGAGGEVEVREDPYFFVWTLQPSGNLLLRRYFDTDNETDIGCNPDISGACTLFDTRVLVPVNRVGERFYWIERRRLDEDTTVPLSSDARFYDRVPLGAAKSATALSRMSYSSARDVR